MVERAKAIRAARDFNQRFGGDYKAIVLEDEPWDNVIRVTGLHGNFVGSISEMIERTNACLRIRDNNTVELF